MPTSGASATPTDSHPGRGATGSWTWTTSKPPARSSRRSVEAAKGVSASRETAPLNGSPIVPPSGISHSGASRGSPSNGASTRGSWPAAMSSAVSASMWRVTPPGWLHE